MGRGMELSTNVGGAAFKESGSSVFGWSASLFSCHWKAGLPPRGSLSPTRTCCRDNPTHSDRHSTFYSICVTGPAWMARGILRPITLRKIRSNRDSRRVRITLTGTARPWYA
jgi:hypothetical protein